MITILICDIFVVNILLKKFDGANREHMVLVGIRDLFYFVSAVQMVSLRRYFQFDPIPQLFVLLGKFIS